MCFDVSAGREAIKKKKKAQKMGRLACLDDDMEPANKEPAKTAPEVCHVSTVSHANLISLLLISYSNFYLTRASYLLLTSKTPFGR